MTVRLGRIGGWYRLVVILLKPTLTVLTRKDWRGFEHFPASGGVIIAANHISHADPLLLGDAVVFSTGRVPRFMAKSTLFEGRGFVARLMRGAKQIPVHRKAADASGALRDAVAALHAGELILIYPEGTVSRDPDKWPMLAKTGVARLALLSGAPVVPIGQWGAQAVLDSYRSPGVHLLPRKTIHVVAGPPVDLSAWEGKELTSDVLHEATAAVMRDVTALVERARGETAPSEVYDLAQQRRSA